MKSTPPTLDLDFVRKQFPEACWEWSFFENAGGSYLPNSVINRMISYMRENRVQPGENFAVAAKAKARMNEGQKCIAAMLGARIDEIVITPSTSFSAYVLAQALHTDWNKGDEVIVAIQNHEANSGPWRRLEKSGLKILDWPINPETGSLETECLDKLLSTRTRLVAFPHVSNIIGEINDVAKITRRVHETNALVCVDGVGYAPHRAIKVKEWDVDFYMFSFYKVFGPHIGCLYGKKELLVEADNQSHYFFTKEDTTHTINPAGPQHEMIASLAGIADYFDVLAEHHFQSPPRDLKSRTSQVFELISQHEAHISEKFIDFITSKSNIRLIGPPSSDRYKRVPTFSFILKFHKPAELLSITAKSKVGLSSGHFYAKRLIQSLGIPNANEGVIRASMAHYTTEAEVDKLISVLDKLL